MRAHHRPRRLDRRRDAAHRPGDDDPRRDARHGAHRRRRRRSPRSARRCAAGSPRRAPRPTRSRTSSWPPTRPCQNAIEHAYGLAPEPFDVRLACEDGAVVVTVRDRGGWRDGRSDDRGRGLPLMRALDRHGRHRAAPHRQHRRPAPRAPGGAAAGRDGLDPLNGNGSGYGGGVRTPSGTSTSSAGSTFHSRRGAPFGRHGSETCRSAGGGRVRSAAWAVLPLPHPSL